MKVLILTTNSYPFGKNEDQLHFQVLSFSKVFDKVYIISSQYDKKILFDLPSNVIPFNLSFNLTPSQKIIGLKNLFNGLLLNELKHIILKRKDVKWYSVIKLLINSFTISMRYARFIDSIIIKDNLTNECLTFYSYWATEASIGSAILKKKRSNLQINLNVRFHAYELYEERHNPHYIPYRNLLISSADKLIFISNQGKEYFENKYGLQENSIVNRLGVRRGNKIDKIDNAEIKIVSCSSLIGLKRVHLIIEALSEIKELKVSWIHIGEGVLKDYLIQQCNEKFKGTNISYCFKGFLNNSLINDFYKNEKFDLFINVSEYEGVPLSIMEAMSNSITCIGTDVGGVKELIDHKSNGYVLDKEFDVKELSQLIVSFSKLSKVDRNKFSENAYMKWEQDFDINLNTKELIDILIKKI